MPSGIRRCPPTPFDISQLHQARFSATAEAEGSSPVVPAIPSKRVVPISLKPRKGQKG